MENKLNHLAIIPDGNRRWAKSNKIELVDAYIFSCDQIFEICNNVLNNERTIRELSLFFISNENIKVRSREDLNALFLAGIYFIDKYSKSISDSKIALNWIGIDHHLVKEVNSDYYLTFIKKIRQCPMVTNPIKNLNILIGYDVVKDINRIINLYQTFTLDKLEIASKIDLIIRTGGNKRLSGFLPLNCQYAEFEFINKYFPEIALFDITQAINNYHEIKLNFGK